MSGSPEVLPISYIKQGLEACRECDDSNSKIKELIARAELYAEVEKEELKKLKRKARLKTILPRELVRLDELRRNPPCLEKFLEQDIIEALRS